LLRGRGNNDAQVLNCTAETGTFCPRGFASKYFITWSSPWRLEQSQAVPTDGTESRETWWRSVTRRDLSPSALPSCLTRWLMEMASFHLLQGDSFRLRLISAFLPALQTGQHRVLQSCHHRNGTATIQWPPNRPSFSWNKFELSHYGAADL